MRAEAKSSLQITCRQGKKKNEKCHLLKKLPNADKVAECNFNRIIAAPK